MFFVFHAFVCYVIFIYFHYTVYTYLYVHYFCLHFTGGTWMTLLSQGICCYKCFFFEQLLIFKKLQIFWYFMHTFIYVYIYIHIYKYIGEILFGIYTSILHKSITCFNCSLGELWWMGGGAWFSHGMAFLRYLFC